MCNQVVKLGCALQNLFDAERISLQCVHSVAEFIYPSALPGKPIHSVNFKQFAQLN